MRDNEQAARAVGVDALRMKALVYLAAALVHRHRRRADLCAKGAHLAGCRLLSDRLDCLCHLHRGDRRHRHASKARSSVSSSSSCLQNLLRRLWLLVSADPRADRHRRHACLRPRGLWGLFADRTGIQLFPVRRGPDRRTISSSRQREGHMADITTDVLDHRHRARRARRRRALLSTYGVENMVDQPLPLAGEYAARPHHQPAHDGGAARPRPGGRGRSLYARHRAGPDGRQRVLHLARRRGDRPDESWGKHPQSRAEHLLSSPCAHERPAADLHGAAAVQDRLLARHAVAHVDGISQPRPGRRRRHHDLPRPADRQGYHHPLEISGRRRRRQLEGRRACRACRSKARWASAAR